MRKLTIIFLFLMVNVWFALGWTPPSPITPPDTIPDAIARMNVGILGGNVPVGGDPCSTCNSNTDGRILEHAGLDGSTDAAWSYARGVRYAFPAGGMCVTGIFLSAGDAGAAAILAYAIYTDDGTSNCDGSLGCPSAVYDTSTETTASGELPDVRADTEVLFSSVRLVPEGNYHAVVYEDNGSAAIVYGHDADYDTSGNNFAGQSPPTSWALSNTDMEVGFLGCTP